MTYNDRLLEIQRAVEEYKRALAAGEEEVRIEARAVVMYQRFGAPFGVVGPGIAIWLKHQGWTTPN